MLCISFQTTTLNDGGDVSESTMNDRPITSDDLFIAFPVGLFAGVASGCVYGSVYWQSLQFEFGRAILLGAAVQMFTSAWIVHRKLKRLNEPNQ